MLFQPSVNQVHTLLSKLAFRQYFYNLLLPVDYFDRFKGNLRKCVNIRHIRYVVLYISIFMVFPFGKQSRFNGSASF